jgi:hypothetical protein
MKTTILLIALFVINICNAQVTFEKSFDLNKTDAGRVVRQTSDNGYIIVGRTNKTGNIADKDVLLIRTNFQGDTVWTKTFGGTNCDTGKDVKETNDNGYIITGHSSSYGSGEADVYIIKTDSLGNEEWMNTFGGPEIDWGLSIRQTSDNGFIITGSTNISTPSNYDLFLVKTNEVGDVEWTRNYGGSGTERGNSIIITNDDNYVICGYTTSFGYGNYDVFLIKTNASGDTIWTKTYGGTEKDCGMSVKQTNDNGFIISGYTNSFGAGDMDFYIIKTNENGDTLWTKTFGGAAYDISCSVDITFENDYVITGYGESFGHETIDVYLIKINQLGNLLWTQFFERKFTDYGNSVQQTTDGGFIIGGTTFNPDSIGFTNSDIYLIKTDTDGTVVGFNNPECPSNKFILFPNPNNGNFIIQNQLNINLIEIYNIRGEVIYKNETEYEKNNNPKIKVGTINEGLYFVKVYSDKEISVLKFIID